MIPDRFFRILRTCEDKNTTHFPPTEVFNEGWMLRLTLDAVRELNVQNHPLHFEEGANWFSEARLASPFAPRSRADKGEGYTNADGVIGHFAFNPLTRAGLELLGTASQFVVVEAKMFSSLSAGTKHAPDYNQAARNVACMAELMAQLTKLNGRRVSDFDSLGFFVIAPHLELRQQFSKNMIEAHLESQAILEAIERRIADYDDNKPLNAAQRDWQTDFLPCLTDLLNKARIEVLSWEKSNELISAANAQTGAELSAFYDQCLKFAAATLKPLI